MKTLLFIFLITVVGGILAGIASNIPQKNNEGNLFEKFISGNSFGSIAQNTAVTAVLKSDHLYIFETLHKDVNVKLNYDKIVEVKVTSDKEITEKSKSVAGRAVIGGLVLGPIGAIIGGASGIGNKVKTEVHNYILIGYMSENEKKAILLQTGMNAWVKFMDELKVKAGIEDIKSVEL